MKNNILKLILVGLIVFAVVGYVFYTRYNSIENQTKRLLRDDVTSWFYEIRSLIYDKPNKLKNEVDKNRAISLRKVAKGLNDKWEFKYEKYNLYEISYSALLIDYDYFFENKETKELQYFTIRYYYDLDEAMPIPLREDIILINGKDYKTLKTNKLWECDFDVYCAKNIEEEENINSQ